MTNRPGAGGGAGVRGPLAVARQGPSYFLNLVLQLLYYSLFGVPPDQRPPDKAIPWSFLFFKFGGCPTGLDLSNTQLKIVPVAIKGLRSLRILKLCNNRWVREGGVGGGRRILSRWTAGGATSYLRSLRPPHPPLFSDRLHPHIDSLHACLLPFTYVIL